MKVRAKPEASYSEFALSVPLYSSRAIGISMAGVVAAGTLLNYLRQWYKTRTTEGVVH